MCKNAEVAAEGQEDFKEQDAYASHDVKHTAFVRKKTNGEVEISDNVFNILQIGRRDPKREELKNLYTDYALKIIRKLEDRISQPNFSDNPNPSSDAPQATKIQSLKMTGARITFNGTEVV